MAGGRDSTFEPSPLLTHSREPARRARERRGSRCACHTWLFSTGPLGASEVHGFDRRPTVLPAIPVLEEARRRTRKTQGPPTFTPYPVKLETGSLDQGTGCRHPSLTSREVRLIVDRRA